MFVKGNLNLFLRCHFFIRHEPIQLHKGHNFQCNHEASKNPLPPMISSKSFRHFSNFCPKTTAAMRYLAIAHQTFPSQLRNSTSKCNILNSQRQLSGKAPARDRRRPRFDSWSLQKTFENISGVLFTWQCNLQRARAESVTVSPYIVGFYLYYGTAHCSVLKWLRTKVQ